MMRLFTTLFSLLLLSFTSLQAQSQSLAVISGKVAGEPNLPVRIVYNRVPFSGKPLQLDALTDQDGKFSFTFELTKKASIDLVHGQNSISLMISPGDSIEMGVQKMDSLTYAYTYSGKGHEESYLNYLNFRDFDKKYVESFSDILKNKDPKVYDATIKSWMKEYRKVLNANLKTVKAGKKLQVIAEGLYQAKEASYYLLYINYHRNGPNRDTTIKIPASFDLAGNNARALEADYVESPEYQNFLILHLTREVPKATSNDMCEGYLLYLNKADSTYKPASKDYLNGRIFAEAFSSQCIKPLKARYNAWAKTTAFPEYREFLDTKVVTDEEPEVGQPAPDFDFVDIDGKTHRLSEFKGKVIYLDFWATWCGPCIRSMNAAKPLKEKYKNNPQIAFVYVSTDQDVNKWKGHAITKSGDPNHWHMGPSAYAATMTYKVFYIPRYILIDKNGNLVNANAPRPDDPALEAELIRLMEQ